jgi:hypothetical protein
MGRARLALVLIGCAALIGTAIAPGAGSQYVERLPRVKAGRILPSAGGLVLGKTTKPQLLARWGPATQCVDIAGSCAWIVGIGRDGSRHPGVTADWISVVFDRNTHWATNIAMNTSSARKSRLRGWKLPEGVGIGSPFPAVRRAYPTVRWLSSTTANTSTWGMTGYEHAGSRYTLTITFDAATRKVASGRVVNLGITWVLPRVTCALTLETASPPEGAPAGRRVRGSCKGAALYAAVVGRAHPLSLRFRGVQGAQVTSASSPFDPACDVDACQTRASDWAVDAILGVSAADAGVEVRVRVPFGPDGPGGREFRIVLG